MWAVDGTWERVFTALMAWADADEELNWVVSVDSTIVRAPPTTPLRHPVREQRLNPRPLRIRQRHTLSNDQMI